MNDNYKLTGKYYPPGEYEENEGKIPPVHSIESTSDALPVGWVSVNDSLPEMHVPVLVFCPEILGLEITIDEWATEYECPVDFSTVTLEIGEGWSMHDFEEVTHWMPLPAPPKDES